MDSDRHTEVFINILHIYTQVSIHTYLLALSAKRGLEAMTLQ